MSSETHESNNTQEHGGFERRDIGVAGVIYFFVGLAVATLVVVFLLMGLYRFLDKRNNAEQAPVNPLVTNTTSDTRKLPPDYKGNYEKYLQENFPAPQLEINERTELSKGRLREEETLNSYGWVDEGSKVVRIPIERAMDLVAERGLPVRPQQVVAAQTPAAKQKKGNKQ